MNAKEYKNKTVVFHEEAEIQAAAPGVCRRILSYSDDAMCV